MLHWACKHNNEEMARLLMQSGADIGIKDKEVFISQFIIFRERFLRIMALLTFSPNMQTFD